LTSDWKGVLGQKGDGTAGDCRSTCSVDEQEVIVEEGAVAEDWRVVGMRVMAPGEL
jgi:hypothetical protein